MIHIFTREELEYSDELDRLIREEECEWLTSLGRRHRSYLEKNGKFPLKITIGPQTKVYRLSEIQAWIKGTWKPE
ncbi:MULTISPECIES: helix-turn-helix transcriptional regulator [Xenorhabdus]|uniref:AlpA family transcriptional regulator n=1 Tax=Xenorhabdus ishibashii TaxID=1034471 RepID=A0A2D0K9B2_9GAMM|nr:MULTISPECIES: AlpA family phage regulatory protein [Xenorhabdus]PHM39234.1 AlpA family transcriptional regulator [Xenorhabdus szentirmaii]PHM59141.1 AlpA family transcriptional regulator [Xenorhabdus ishibashii]PHM59170.1 AlpA family transcriptional regulator [Xenorhabdus ishibashii]PHM60038.1 AlpA family transcriptional regulator [Xenorhabdus ishibashii]PHM60044.1 AlpA family transcriptional regulator [Xenorhabdus ishibashii]